MNKVVLAAAVAAAMVAAPVSAAFAAGAAGEFGNNCAFGLTKGAKKYTDCSVMEKIDGKVYCFSKQSAKEEFMKDAKGNLEKAETFYNDN
ncbi:MAG: hypothetical protein AAF354_03165 [Pseudomonadota bacterium]